MSLTANPTGDGCRARGTPPDVRVVEIDYRTDRRWEDFLASHPNALFYHHPVWLQALEAEYGQPCIGLACENAAGAILGVLPLSYTRGLPFRLGEHETGRRLSSLPRTPIAGPVATSGEVAAALIQEALRRASSRPGVQFELKAPPAPTPQTPEGLFPKAWRLTYVVGLPDRPEKLRFGDSRNHSRIKWAVNKANRMGLRIRNAESESDLRAWYQLYLETMRDNAAPSRPYRLFQALWALARPRNLMWLLLAEQHEGGTRRLVAGSMFLLFNQTVFYAFNGVNRHALPLRANDLLQWHAMHEACGGGFRWYDLGEVSRDHPQLADFKSKWGAQPRRLYRYYYPAPHGERDEDSPKAYSKLFYQAWRRLPVRWAARIGDWLYGFM